MIAIHLGLAGLLFWMVNWIGEHATDFGYASMTLFEIPNDSVAFNFFIRALAPAVFTVALSATAVSAGHPELRLNIFMVAAYYYLIRAAYIFFMNLHLLVSWPRFFAHSIVGLGSSWLSYKFLILPNRSLLPDLDAAGNEIWLAIFAFLYAAANKLRSDGVSANKRRNLFILRGYTTAKRRYGEIISNITKSDQLQLIVYATIIYEDYCRPPAIRFLERRAFWKIRKTTGIMQFLHGRPLTDAESVRMGATKLSSSWRNHAHKYPYARTYSTLTEYNKDSDYAHKVMEIMNNLAKRSAPEFGPAYDEMMQSPTPSKSRKPRSTLKLVPLRR